jgi:hypothetical protein
MLQRLTLSDLDELDRQCGLLSRSELEAMDAAFVARVEAAFRAGLESRVAAAATVRVGHRNGRETAIESAWRYLRTNMDVGVDISFVEILAFARERCSRVTAEQVRVEFKKRFKGRWQSTAI